MIRFLLTIWLFLMPTFIFAAVPPDAVVRVFVEDRGNEQSAGSGTLVVDNFVITNSHVVRDKARNGKIRVLFPDWDVCEATLIKQDKVLDLALLRINSSYHKPITLGNVPKKGDSLTVGGYGPGWYENHTGKLLRFYLPDQRSTSADLLCVDAQVRNGDSGGAILNNNGELVGVLFGCRSDGTYGAHIDCVKKFLGVD